MQSEVEWFLSALIDNQLITLEKGIEINDALGGSPDVLTYAQEILNILCDGVSEEDARNWASQLEEVIAYAQEQAASGAVPELFQQQVETVIPEQENHPEESEAPSAEPAESTASEEPTAEPENLFEKLRLAVAHQQQVVEQRKAHLSSGKDTEKSGKSGKSSSKSVESASSGAAAAGTTVSLDDSDYEESSELPDIRTVSSMSDAEVAVCMKHLLLGLRAYGVSDLHISSNAPLFIRRSLALERLDPEWVVPDEDAQRMNLALLSEEQREKFRREQDISFGLEIGKARFRTALMYHKDGISGSYRLVPDRIQTLEELGFLPDDARNIRRLLDYTNGLILVTGPLGSGKTTTLAAMIEVANQNREDHIITVEDPIEIIQTSKKCQITQREIGRCTNSYHAALKGALREDPDIIVIGEMHDLETIENAITASETGHLVIGTLHTCDAGNTLNRVLDVFPPSQQPQIRAMTAGSLRGIICQRLIPAANGGLTIAYEILINTIAVGNIISEGKIYQLPATMQIGSKAGMCTLDQNLLEKYKAGHITYETALYYMKDTSIMDQLKKLYAMQQAQQFMAEKAAREAAAAAAAAEKK